MGKSNETFNKKEKEKKRLKKQQEKKEKADLRKANSSKGKDLEEMFAYVDENGNITSTKPVAVKKPVQADEILTATPKQIPEPEGQLNSGIISFYNTTKGYGFIRDTKTQQNIFFHVGSLSYPAKENDKVAFATEKGVKGINAVQIIKL